MQGSKWQAESTRIRGGLLALPAAAAAAQQGARRQRPRAAHKPQGIEGTCAILVLHSSHVAISRAQPQGQRSLVHNALLAGERQRFCCCCLRHLSRLYLVDALPQLACGDAAVCSNSLEGFLREATG